MKKLIFQKYVFLSTCFMICSMLTNFSLYNKSKNSTSKTFYLKCNDDVINSITDFDDSVKFDTKEFVKTYCLIVSLVAF